MMKNYYVRFAKGASCTDHVVDRNIFLTWVVVLVRKKIRRIM